MTRATTWPALPYDEWAPTKKTLQMCSQMIGKTRLALAPPQPEWLHTCLYLDPRGFTTGPVPRESRSIALGMDLYDSSLWARSSDGREASVSLGTGRCVADIWSDLAKVLARLDLELDTWEKPQEMADMTPFSENTHDCTVVPEQAQRFHRLLTTCETAPIEPEHAGWVEAMGEWMMPYQAVCTCPDPRQAVLDFLRSVYRVACTQAGWDAESFEYAPPAPPARSS